MTTKPQASCRRVTFARTALDDLWVLIDGQWADALNCRPRPTDTDYLNGCAREAWGVFVDFGTHTALMDVYTTEERAQEVVAHFEKTGRIGGDIKVIVD
jgi:hypothetical protein